LSACGLRSINNVVDASNLVMLELGQPVHFFDLALVRGAAIRVRAAHADETLTTLDGVSRALAPGMIVIADQDAAVGLGGVMGGAETQITDQTRDVLIEAAWFTPAAVRTTARGLGLSTDASQRFERGCDPEAPQAAQDLAVRLLVELAGGTAAPGMIDVRPTPAAVRTVTLRPERAARLLGYPVPQDEALRALGELGLDPKLADGAIQATIPSWRVDLLREADLVEEIGRHWGYDRIPSRTPADAPRADATPPQSDAEERVRDRFAALGFNEAVNYAMIGPGDDDAFVPIGDPPPLALLNPISEMLGYLRRSLLPGLLRAADQNLRRGIGDVRLFEIGAVFEPRGPGAFPGQPTHAGFAWTGASAEAHWSNCSRPVDAWDAAGVVEDLLAVCAGDAPFDRDRGAYAAFHPGQSLLWRDAGGRAVAWCGRVHPDVVAKLDLTAPIWLGALNLEAATAHGTAGLKYQPIPRFPGMTRDLSVVLDAEAVAGDVTLALGKVRAPSPVAFRWIDRFEGKPLAPGQSAMTLRVMLHPLDRTLTDAEAEGYRAELVKALDSIPGVHLRRIDT
jgi:phenylalanyl-tRNA synthetase beta chain